MTRPTTTCTDGRRSPAPLVGAPTNGHPGFSFAALAAAAGNPGVSALARQLGLTRRTIHRWQRTGLVPAARADLAAIRLGHHPAEIWPTEWSIA